MLTSTDHKLPALARATDGRAMGVTLSAALGLKGTVHVRPEMLKHAPGKRAVLAYTLSGHGDQHLRIVGKLYRDDRGARAFELLWAVWQAARSTARGRLELPEPIAYLPELGMVVQGAVAGRPLAHFGPADDWHGAIRQVAEALAAFHDLDVRELAPRPLADHVRRTCHPGPQVLTNWYPELAVLIQRALESVQPGDDPARAPRGAAHGDLGVSQVFVGRVGSAFVDLDSTCLAPPALDLGRLIVSLRSRLGTRACRLEVELLERYRAARPGASLTGIERYVALAYLRRACATLRRGPRLADFAAARAALAAAAASGRRRQAP